MCVLFGYPPCSKSNFVRYLTKLCATFIIGATLMCLSCSWFMNLHDHIMHMMVSHIKYKWLKSAKFPLRISGSIFPFRESSRTVPSSGIFHQHVLRILQCCLSLICQTQPFCRSTNYFNSSIQTLAAPRRLSRCHNGIVKWLVFWQKVQLPSMIASVGISILAGLIVAIAGSLGIVGWCHLWSCGVYY